MAAHGHDHDTDHAAHGHAEAHGEAAPKPAWKFLDMDNPAEQGFWERLYLPEVVRGLAITGGHFWKNMFLWVTGRKGAVTFQYPEQVRPVSPRSRGKHVLMKREDGSPRCVACYMCAAACPAQCIHIVAGEHPDPAVEKYPVRFDIDVSRCIFCGMCEEACPKDAIRLSTDYHLALYDRRKIYDKDFLLSWNEQPAGQASVVSIAAVASAAEKAGGRK
jgi:NADH-quinone oxidoreductase subunit I